MDGVKGYDKNGPSGNHRGGRGGKTGKNGKRGGHRQNNSRENQFPQYPQNDSYQPHAMSFSYEQHGYENYNYPSQEYGPNPYIGNSYAGLGYGAPEQHAGYPGQGVIYVQRPQNVMAGTNGNSMHRDEYGAAYPQAVSPQNENGPNFLHVGHSAMHHPPMVPTPCPNCDIMRRENADLRERARLSSEEIAGLTAEIARLTEDNNHLSTSHSVLNDQPERCKNDNVSPAKACVHVSKSNEALSGKKENDSQVEPGKKKIRRSTFPHAAPPARKTFGAHTKPLWAHSDPEGSSSRAVSPPSAEKELRHEHQLRVESRQITLSRKNSSQRLSDDRLEQFEQPVLSVVHAVTTNSISITESQDTAPGESNVTAELKNPSEHELQDDGEDRKIEATEVSESSVEVVLTDTADATSTTRDIDAAIIPSMHLSKSDESTKGDATDFHFNPRAPDFDILQSTLRIGSAIRDAGHCDENIPTSSEGKPQEGYYNAEYQESCSQAFPQNVAPQTENIIDIESVIRPQNAADLQYNATVLEQAYKGPENSATDRVPMLEWQCGIKENQTSKGYENKIPKASGVKDSTFSDTATRKTSEQTCMTPKAMDWADDFDDDILPPLEQEICNTSDKLASSIDTGAKTHLEKSNDVAKCPIDVSEEARRDKVKMGAPHMSSQDTGDTIAQPSVAIATGATAEATTMNSGIPKKPNSEEKNYANSQRKSSPVAAASSPKAAKTSVKPSPPKSKSAETPLGPASWAGVAAQQSSIAEDSSDTSVRSIKHSEPGIPYPKGNTKSKDPKTSKKASQMLQDRRGMNMPSKFINGARKFYLDNIPHDVTYEMLSDHVYGGILDDLYVNGLSPDYRNEKVKLQPKDHDTNVWFGYVTFYDTADAEKFFNFIRCGEHPTVSPPEPEKWRFEDLVGYLNVCGRKISVFLREKIQRKVDLGVKYAVEKENATRCLLFTFGKGKTNPYATSAPGRTWTSADWEKAFAGDSNHALERIREFVGNVWNNKNPMYIQSLKVLDGTHSSTPQKPRGLNLPFNKASTGPKGPIRVILTALRISTAERIKTVLSGLPDFKSVTITYAVDHCARAIPTNPPTVANLTTAAPSTEVASEGTCAAGPSKPEKTDDFLAEDTTLKPKDEVSAGPIQNAWGSRDITRRLFALSASKSGAATTAGPHGQAQDTVVTAPPSSATQFTAKRRVKKRPAKESGKEDSPTEKRSEPEQSNAAQEVPWVTVTKRRQAESKPAVPESKGG